MSVADAPLNRLAREKSPYLLQHARNPVDWYAWNGEAFAKARQENKPILLSIGYSTCHWCHVMERESFEDKKVGAFLAEHFVNIKVDREERPDVDKIYMTAMQAMGLGGGWPLNCFLTPDLKPFYGGTYFPPEPKHGRPSFLQMLQHIAHLWANRREEIQASADGMCAQLGEFMAQHADEERVLSPALLHTALGQCKQEYDRQNGGFGGAPKFPRPSQPLLVLQAGKRFGDIEAVGMVLHTCERMAAGGMNDQLGGGFARYSVDAQWLVPHFEKMLYDNAQLVPLYLDAFLVSGEARHAETAREVLRYVQRDMTHPEGGFYSAEDADSEGKEGKFYCWTKSELGKILTVEEYNVAAHYYGITGEGNFVDHSDPQPLPNQNVLSIVQPDVPAADRPLLASAQEKMRTERARRVRPHLDDKVLASWNGLMLAAFARAYAVLGEETFRTTAERNLAFLQAKLWDAPTQTLYHRWREGERDATQLLEDYACLLTGVLELYQATLTVAHLEFAVALAEAMLAKFQDARLGGFFQSAAGTSDLILRVKDDYDGAEPSGNSVAALALLKLAAITDRAEFKLAAEKTLRLFAERLERLPQAVPHMLLALDFWLQEPKRVVVTGDPQTAVTQALLRVVHTVYQPNKVVLGQAGPVEAVAKKLPVAGTPQVFLCTGTECLAPTNEAGRIREGLGK